ncbi:MAG TPA: ABC transporter permease [Thermoanaerobaculia bacterium]|nr:ABC transporter permease [Thermoanaerobaculia bacterium]
MTGLFRDLRDAAQSLLRSPGLTAVAVLTLTLGIGATTSVFTVAWRVLARPLPYAEAGELAAVFTTEPGAASQRNPTSPANFLDWAARSETLAEWTAAHPWSPAFTGWGPADQIPALKATPSLFTLLGASPAVGSVFRGDAELGDGRVVVLSHRLWSRRFGSDPAIVGRALELDGAPYLVLGVMPPGFRFPPFWATEAELWAPLLFSPEAAASRRASYLRVFARRAPTATLEEAQAELDGIMAGLLAAHPEENEHLGVRVEPLREPVVSAAREPLGLLLGAVGLVLLVACANVAGLFLARSLDREREWALRAALGARRGEIVRRSLLEGALVALVGGAAGSWLAALVLEALRAFEPPGVPRIEEIHLDPTVLGFTLGVSLLAALLAGLVPALRTARRDPEAVLRRSGRSGQGRDQRAWRPLVVAQMALASLLLAGAALMIRSLLSLAGQDPGFRAEAVLTADLALGASVHGEAERQPHYFGRVLEAVAAVPGVESAALVNHLPIAGDVWRGDLDLEGRPELDPPPKAILRVVSPGYFEALGVPVLEGRGFDGTERPDGPRQVVVNRALAELLPARASAVGARLRFAGGSPEGPWMEVVGVAGDARQDRLRDPVEPEAYFPYAQNPFAWFRQSTLVVRTAGGAFDLFPAVQAAVRGVDEDVPIVRARALEEVLAHDLAGPRFLAALLGGFAAVAVLLAAVGLYGLVSFAVRRRRWEIGLRMSLGADRLDVLRLVVVQGTALAGLGLALGLAGALAAGRLLEGLLYGVRPTDPASFALGGAVLLAAALAASYLPAHRALAVDPAESLRAE